MSVVMGTLLGVVGLMSVVMGTLLGVVGLMSVVMGTLLGVVGLMSVYCVWVREELGPVTSFAVWQHVLLSRHVCPGDALGSVAARRVVQVCLSPRCSGQCGSTSCCAGMSVPEMLLACCQGVEQATRPHTTSALNHDLSLMTFPCHRQL